jgi:hypothetical protein
MYVILEWRDEANLVTGSRQHQSESRAAANNR